jgi:hypothetical protein
MSEARGWLLLILTLPTRNATARMRFWRNLKSMGCVMLRDGVYLLPRNGTNEEALLELADAITKSGGTADVLRTASRDRTQDRLFRALFDRGEDYAQFLRSLGTARKSLSSLRTPGVNRLLRRLRREYEALRTTDFFPGEATKRAEVGWTDFLGAVDTALSPDEPHAIDGRVRRLERREYRGRTWATRRHLWIDRVASAWLIRRFIDPEARFLWLDKPSACPKKAIGFDFDGAAFSHVGDRVTFEVLLESFGLDDDDALVRLGELVHSLDVGGRVVPEASGFEALMSGARQRAKDDTALLQDMSGPLDALHLFYGNAPVRRRRR